MVSENAKDASSAPLTPEIEAIRKAKESWESNTLQKHQKKHPNRTEEYVTTSSRPIKVLYTPEDIPNFDYMRDLSFPSQYPYTRGVQPSMYRGRLWTMRQFAGMGSAEETNERFKFLLANGQTGLSVAFHLPTLYGYDSGSEFSLGEVGKCGVAIDTLKDMEILFDGIPLDRVTSSMTI
ncbi:MAG: methylmalonyl-CoA mutase family protein, partial [Candidatus Thorarchaeota archaeon]